MSSTMTLTLFLLNILFFILPILAAPIPDVAAPVEAAVNDVANTKSFSATSSTSSAAPSATPSDGPSSAGGSCFPALGFKMPSSVPDSTDNWWCDASTEYAFLGFSYEVTACQSPSQLQKEFADIRTRFKGRYVRLYGACDKKGFYDDVVDAAWDNGLGVHALVWFGFDGGNQWKTRRDTLFATLKSNPKAKFVTRGVQFGSEPLFDSVLTPSQLAAQVTSAKSTLAPLGIPVTVSELQYGYAKNGGAQNVLDSLDFINIHMLPFFSTKATSGEDAWPLVESDLKWFTEHGKGKKMYFDENGWPSTTYEGVSANSKAAVSSVSSEQGYFDMLDSKCTTLKAAAGGGVGWFAHIYSDDQEPGYGILNGSGKLKFPFAPRTSC